MVPSAPRCRVPRCRVPRWRRRRRRGCRLLGPPRRGGRIVQRPAEQLLRMRRIQLPVRHISAELRRAAAQRRGPPRGSGATAAVAALAAFFAVVASSAVNVCLSVCLISVRLCAGVHARRRRAIVARAAPSRLCSRGRHGASSGASSGLPLCCSPTRGGGGGRRALRVRLAAASRASASGARGRLPLGSAGRARALLARRRCCGTRGTARCRRGVPSGGCSRGGRPRFVRLCACVCYQERSAARRCGCLCWCCGSLLQPLLWRWLLQLLWLRLLQRAGGCASVQ